MNLRDRICPYYKKYYLHIFDIHVLCCLFCHTHISHFVPQNKKAIHSLQPQFSQNKISKCKDVDKRATFLILFGEENKKYLCAFLIYIMRHFAKENGRKVFFY